MSFFFDQFLLGTFFIRRDGVLRSLSPLHSTPLTLPPTQVKFHFFFPHFNPRYSICNFYWPCDSVFLICFLYRLQSFVLRWDWLQKEERMAYIGAHGVAALHRHKYSGVDNSLLAKYVLQPFWTRCVNFFPLWMP